MNGSAQLMKSDVNIYLRENISKLHLELLSACVNSNVLKTSDTKLYTKQNSSIIMSVKLLIENGTSAKTTVIPKCTIEK